MTPDDRARLTRLLGMLGSSFPGEVLNAAQAAHRALTQMGFTWEEALNGTGDQGWTEDQVRRVAEEAHAAGYEKGLAAGGGKRPRDEGWLTWRGLAKSLIDDHDDLLNDWERMFCSGFLERGFPTPTVKQQAVFERIAEKCGEDCPA